jgi:uncharacterized protein
VSLTPTFPGVYIEEIPSGQHTITPVATTITAFVGRAPFGPTDEVLTIFSFGDFIRFYGGLSLDYPMSYAVQDFFNNGGSQAVIARLFEPASSSDSGVALLPFPPSPPMIPDGWMLAAPAAAGTGLTTLAVSGPTGGSEGEPLEGMLFSLNSASGSTYTVSSYNAPAKGNPGSITFFPPLTGIPGQIFSTCTPLFFQESQSPSGWQVLTPGQSSLTLNGGAGIPSMGDTFTVGSGSTQYTITAEPTITATNPNAVSISINFSPATKTLFTPGSTLNISPPQPSPMPIGWQIQQFTAGATGKPSTLVLINGVGNPLIGDQFTVGSNSTNYVVAGFAPATVTPAAPAVLTFNVVGGGPVPTNPTAFCFCCTLNFVRPLPQNFAIKSSPKANAYSFVIGNNNGAATGVIDIGYTFTVQGDDTIYTVVLYNQSSGVISFLPSATNIFSAASTAAIIFSPPLQLVAASPGAWGNSLTASVDTNGITVQTAAQFQSYGLQAEDLFNLTLVWSDARGRTITSERYLNCSVNNTGVAGTFPNRLDRLLAANSMLAQVSVLPLAPPATGSAAIGSGGGDGTYLSPLTYIGDQDQQTGLYMFEQTPLFNLMCIPPDRRAFDDVPISMQDLDSAVRLAAATYCTDRRAIYIVDPPAIWEEQVSQGNISVITPDSLGITGENSDGIEIARNAAVYFPRVIEEDLLLKSQLCTFAPCGMVAGVIAATDVSRGVWKSPAGVDAGLAGASALTVSLTNPQNGILNPLGINCLRTFPIAGNVVWGARTLRGADQFEDDYKYLSVRRLTLFIEDSLYIGTQWAVFEPNDESLWSSLRLTVNSFLAGLSRQGAFYNYLVTCDATTTTPTDIALGKVNILVQIAPVYPAEFVMIQIQQIAGTSAS